MSINACHHWLSTVCLSALCIHTLTSGHVHTMPSTVHPSRHRFPPPLVLCSLYLTAAPSDHKLTMVYAGQQVPGVGAESTAAQPLGAAASNASRQSYVQRPVKCRFFTSRNGR